MCVLQSLPKRWKMQLETNHIDGMFISTHYSSFTFNPECPDVESGEVSGTFCQTIFSTKRASGSQQYHLIRLGLSS